MNREHAKTRHQQSEKKKRRKAIIVILLAILALIILFFISRCCMDTNTVEMPEPSYLEDEGSSLDGEAATEDREDILEELEKQQLVVTDKLSSNIAFPSGEIRTVGEWVVENPAENTVIQQAEVYLDDLMIAKSSAIYPNQHITAIELLESVETGEYDVTAYINYYDMETKALISKAGYKIHLTVD